MWSAALSTDENKMTTPTMTRINCAFFFIGLDRSRLTNLDRSRFDYERNQSSGTEGKNKFILFYDRDIQWLAITICCQTNATDCTTHAKAFELLPTRTNELQNSFLHYCDIFILWLPCVYMYIYIFKDWLLHWTLYFYCKIVRWPLSYIKGYLTWLYDAIKDIIATIIAGIVCVIKPWSRDLSGAPPPETVTVRYRPVN